MIHDYEGEQWMNKEYYYTNRKIMSERQYENELLTKQFRKEIKDAESTIVPTMDELFYTNGNDENVIKSKIQQLRTGYVNYYGDLGGACSLKRRIIIFFKRLIRKCMKFLLLPIINQINAEFSKMILVIDNMEDDILELKKRNKELEDIIKKDN